MFYRRFFFKVIKSHKCFFHPNKKQKISYSINFFIMKGEKIMNITYLVLILQIKLLVIKRKYLNNILSIILDNTFFSRDKINYVFEIFNSYRDKKSLFDIFN